MAGRVRVNKSTKFSRLICEYIEASGYTVYKLSQLAGLDRTAVQHIMAGKFVPKKDFFDKLCSVLFITPLQKRELTELYLEEKYGRKAYNERKCMKRIIENLPQYYINVPYSVESNFDSEIETGVVSGIINVNRTIIAVIIRELHRNKPRISTTIPFSNKMLFDVVIQMLGSYSDEAVFEHYLRIFRSIDNTADENLDTLENVLKMSMNAGIAYNPYSYYAYRVAVDDSLSVFPYCLITSEFAVLVSSDCQSVLISDDNAMYNIVRKHIDTVKLSSQPMVKLVENKDMFDIFVSSTRFYDKSIEYQPCVTKYLTWDIITNRLRHIPEREYILNVLRESFFSAEEIEVTSDQEAVCVFSQKGLEHFTDTGSMINLPGQLLEPLSVSERLYMLECIKNDRDCFRMINSDKLYIPDFIQMIYMNNQSGIISCITNDKKFICVVNEHSLSLSFDDFITSLFELEITATEDEMVSAINRCIDKLRTNYFSILEI
ncbi:MAG: helix-turn-helix transcriptional regulator [Oscillospiraceae bacterium]|nr:helix-turn-helix transcriptional regulator [Oscillospiraceae bacterium]